MCGLRNKKQKTEKKKIRSKIIRAGTNFLPVRARLSNSLFLTLCGTRRIIILKHFDFFLGLFYGPQPHLYLINNLLTQFKIDATMILGLLGCEILAGKVIREDKDEKKITYR
jgi:hypothetical protein